MIAVDVPILLYAHREEYEEHARYAAWLVALAEGDEPFGISELVLSGFVRIATNRRVFEPPSTTDQALRFCKALLGRPTCVRLRPGPRHWGIFERLCRSSNARAGLVADAYHAALAIEHGAEWVTTDADFDRFEGLRWRHPLAPSDQ